MNYLTVRCAVYIKACFIILFGMAAKQEKTCGIYCLFIAIIEDDRQKTQLLVNDYMKYFMCYFQRSCFIIISQIIPSLEIRSPASVLLKTDIIGNPRECVLFLDILNYRYC